MTQIDILVRPIRKQHQRWVTGLKNALRSLLLTDKLITRQATSHLPRVASLASSVSRNRKHNIVVWQVNGNCSSFVSNGSLNYVLVQKPGKNKIKSTETAAKQQKKSGQRHLKHQCCASFCSSSKEGFDKWSLLSCFTGSSHMMDKLFTKIRVKIRHTNIR